MACGGPGGSTAARSPIDLEVGFPEDNVSGGDFGVGQFANLLSFESLTNNGADGRAVPRLADSWQWENDGLRLRVVLHKGVLLHDGRPFVGETAAAVVRRAVTSPRNQAAYAALADISNISAPNALELIFDLQRPSALLPEDLAVPLDVGADAVGTGPYMVSARGKGETVLKRFDNYYLGLPNVRQVRVHSFQTLRTAWTSLLRGQVDMVYDVPADALEFVRNEDVQIVRLERWYQYVIAFNSKTGALRNPAIRRALNMAVDRSALIERVLRGAGKPSNGAVWPNYWAYDASVPGFTYNPMEAAAILDAAGFPIRPGSAGKPPARFRIECLVPENFAVWEQIALEVQKSLFGIGVDMQFRVVALSEFNARVSTGDFQAAFIDMISGPTPGRSYMFWRSAKREKGAYNVFGYENVESEEAFRVLRTITSEAATRSATRRLQVAFVEDPPALFLAWNQRARAIRADFLIPKVNGRDPVWWLWQWQRAPRSATASAE